MGSKCAHILSLFLTIAALGQQNRPLICAGKVVDAQGRSVAEAKIAAYEIVRGHVDNIKLRLIGERITQANGTFTFEVVPGSIGRHLGAILVVSRQGYAIGWANWDMKGDANVSIDLGEPTRLEGRILDEMGAPIGDAEIRAVLFRKKVSGRIRDWLPGIAPLPYLVVKSDSMGRFQFTNIPVDVDIDLLVSAKGRATIYTHRPAAKPRFTAGQTDVRVILPPEGRIEGTVVEAGTGKGIPNVTLTVVSNSSTTFFDNLLCVSGEDGTFRLGGLRAGNYVIVLGSHRLNVWIVSGEVTDDVVLECPGVVQGRVTGPDGEPIVNAEIQIREYNPGARSIAAPNVQTNKQGYYMYTGIGWPYTVGCLRRHELPNGRGYRSHYLGLRQVRKDSQTVNFKFEVFPTGTAGLSGKVTDQYGQAVRDFRVDIRNKVDWKDRSKDVHQYVYKLSLSTTDGTFEAGALPAGVHRIGIYPIEGIDFKSYSAEVTLEEGKSVNINPQVVKTPAAAGVQKGMPYYGRILFDDGTPAVPYFPPWPDARTHVRWGRSVTSLDSADVDHEGYFTAYLTREKHTSFYAGKDHMRIYFPSHKNRRHSSVAGIFPVQLLSLNKSEAGVVKISKPFEPTVDSRNALPLIGGALPRLGDLGIDFSRVDIKDKSLLVCFWDMAQRPSRHCMIQLAKQADYFEREGVIVVTVQASKADEAKVNEWVKKHNIPFLVGRVREDAEEIRLAWAVKSLPWLILADSKHTVRAEGFAPSELNARMKEVNKEEE